VYNIIDSGNSPVISTNLTVTHGSQDSSMSDDSSFLSRVQNLVESEEFFNDLRDEIDKIENPTNRAKALFELISYVSPKLKTQDADAGNQGQAISIVFTDAVEHPRDSEEVVDEDCDPPAPISEEIPPDQD